MRPHPFLIVALVGALLGMVFAGFSTYDFAQHLDRRVHDVHCSFIPGVAEGAGGSSGCEETLMSAYSSVFRSSIWGGIPISLPALSLFAFLLFFGADLMFARRQEDPRACGFFAVASMIPVAASAVMAYVSFAILGATCKLCVGIYVSSLLLAVGSGGLWYRAFTSSGGGLSGASRRSEATSDPAWASEGGSETDPEAPVADESPGSEYQARRSPSTDGGGVERIGYGKLAGFAVLGIMFLAVPVGAYVGAAPSHEKFIGTCGSLDEPPSEKLTVEMGPQRGVPALEIFDPLCPACRGFERQFESTGFDRRLARRAVLFPLDDECNWMLDQSVHPGACAVSEAILCGDGETSRKVVDWAFERQQHIRDVASKEGRDVRELIGEKFPDLESCVGSPQVQSKLNQSLRWAVENEIKILTPQFYVDGVRLCDADTDLGLGHTLSTMLRMREEGRLNDRVDEADSGDEGAADQGEDGS